jgi:hypothetical protein
MRRRAWAACLALTAQPLLRYWPTVKAICRCQGCRLWVFFAHRATANQSLAGMAVTLAISASLCLRLGIGGRVAAAGRGCGQVDQLVAQAVREVPVDVGDPAPAFGPLGPFGDVGDVNRAGYDVVHRHAQVVEGGGEGGADALLAPDAVQVETLPSLVRKPGDGVGDDVGPIAAKLARRDDLSVARNRFALAISRRQYALSTAGVLSPSLIMNSRKFFSAPRLTMCGS